MILKPVNLYIYKITNFYRELYKREPRQCVCRRAQMDIFYEICHNVDIFEYEIEYSVSLALTCQIWELHQLALTFGFRRAVATHYMELKSDQITKEMPQLLFPKRKHMTWEHLLDYNSKFIHEEDFKLYAENFRMYCRLKALRPSHDINYVLFIAHMTKFLIPYIRFGCNERENVESLQPFLDMLKDLEQSNAEHERVFKGSQDI